MADTTLKTDYKDDVLDTSVNERRKYQMIQNEDGTVSFVDVTEYLEVGDSFGALDVNTIAGKINDSLKGVTFASLEDAVMHIQEMDKDELIIGQPIFITPNNQPDLWVYAVTPERVIQTSYIGDAAFIKALSSSLVQVGYYVLRPSKAIISNDVHDIASPMIYTGTLIAIQMRKDNVTYRLQIDQNGRLAMYSSYLDGVDWNLDYNLTDIITNLKILTAPYEINANSSVTIDLSAHVGQVFMLSTQYGGFYRVRVYSGSIATSVTIADSNITLSSDGTNLVVSSVKKQNVSFH